MLSGAMCPAALIEPRMKPVGWAAATTHVNLRSIKLLTEKDGVSLDRLARFGATSSEPWGCVWVSSPTLLTDADR